LADLAAERISPAEKENFENVRKLVDFDREMAMFQRLSGSENQPSTQVSFILHLSLL
jgi:hypothetical protein